MVNVAKCREILGDAIIDSILGKDLTKSCEKAAKEMDRVMDNGKRFKKIL